MQNAIAQKPGIFWTWQDGQIENPSLVRASIGDMAAQGFGRLLVQPRGCRYSMVGDPFLRAAADASAHAREHGLEFWLHLDPRSMSRYLIDSAGESTEYIIIAGTGEQRGASTLAPRALDVEARLTKEGSFRIRLEYPKTRPYHVHSDGALSFRPLRLERCLVYRRNGAGIVIASTLADVSSSAEFFVNELQGYVEVFGTVEPREDTGWFVLALVAFTSNYPDFASDASRVATRRALDRFVRAGVGLDGLWWDEPGYCTGFDRSFSADRGRIPWGNGLQALYSRRTGRDAADDLVYLIAETDDHRWGATRESYYRTLEDAVFGAQADLLAHARQVVGDHVSMGVHQTWHQNGDDAIHGTMDWWRGSEVLRAGYADVGDADRIDDPDQMAEVTALATIAVGMGRHSASRTAHYNLWGVHYGTEGTVPGPDVLAWWVDLQATIGCNWLAHTYGPTGYFERPSVWGPGYPDHPTWEDMADATGRLARASVLTRGTLPECDVAFVYPLGTMYRLGSELANPLAHGVHMVIDAMVRSGFELDVVSAETLRRCPENRYRAVLYLHPFGASPDDVDDLGTRAQAGAQIVVAGLPAVIGETYAGAEHWRARLGLDVPELTIEQLFDAGARELSTPPTSRTYRGIPLWGRPRWAARQPQDGNGDPVYATRSNRTHFGGDGTASYLGLLLEGFGATSPHQLRQLELSPSWHVPSGAIGSRTRLTGGETLVKLCPGRFGQTFHGALRFGRTHIAMENGTGLTCIRIDSDGHARMEMAPVGLEWTVEDAAV